MIVNGSLNGHMVDVSSKARDVDPPKFPLHIYIFSPIWKIASQ